MIYRLKQYMYLIVITDYVSKTFFVEYVRLMCGCFLLNTETTAKMGYIRTMTFDMKCKYCVFALIFATVFRVSQSRKKMHK